MNPAVFEKLESRFTNYVAQFRSENAEHDRAIRLKIDHTRRVVQAIGWIARQLQLTDDRRRLAEAMALLHDIGRFRQYQRYGTYLDVQTENHALLGLRVIAEEHFLAGVEPSEQRLIESPIAVHNAAVLPTDADPDSLFFMRLLRDADKLDIWKVVLDHYFDRAEEPSVAVGLGLPDRPEYSPAVLEAIRDQRLVSFADIVTLTDFKLMQLSWVFDLNFRPTFAWVERERYVEQMAEVLPKTPPVQELVGMALAHVACQLARAADPTSL